MREDDKRAAQRDAILRDGEGKETVSVYGVLDRDMDREELIAALRAAYAEIDDFVMRGKE